MARWYALLSKIANEYNQKYLLPKLSGSKPMSLVSRQDSSDLEVEVDRTQSSAAVLMNPYKKKHQPVVRCLSTLVCYDLFFFAFDSHFCCSCILCCVVVLFFSVDAHFTAV
jgi:hypothetical protein